MILYIKDIGFGSSYTYSFNPNTENMIFLCEIFVAFVGARVLVFLGVLLENHEKKR